MTHRRELIQAARLQPQ